MAPAITVHVDSDDDTEQFIDILQRGFEIYDGKLRFNGRPFLSHVPHDIHISSSCSSFDVLRCPLFSTSALKSNGSFLGFSAREARSSHVVSLGKFKGIRFTSLFRFKPWWTAPWVGDRGSDLENETQILLLDTKSRAASDGCLGYPYILIVPIYEGSFRASLQAGKDDHIDLCIESGSTLVCQSHFKSCVYLHAGHDPFSLLQNAVKAIQTHLGTFRHISEKTTPSIIDRFGLSIKRDPLSDSCHSNPEHVWEAVRSLVEGGVPPRFLIFDEGWQANGDHDFYELFQHSSPKGKDCETKEMWNRLMSFQESEKFREYLAGTLITPSKTKSYSNHDEINHAHYTYYETEDDNVSDTCGMGAFILDLKSEFELLEDVYAWHTICGYRGGVLPGSPDSCNASLVKPELALGIHGSMQDRFCDQLLANNIGLVPPRRAHQFFDRFHAHLEKCGFTGVKLDAINMLEMLGEEHGGQIRLAKAYFDALGSSVRKNFGGNRVLANMQHSNEFMLLGTTQIALGRVGDLDGLLSGSDDTDSTKITWQHGAYLVQCAFNSLWLGQFMHPDWGTFRSLQNKAAFHAAARAISGGAICLNDETGRHNMEILKRLVLPDGTVPRCSSFALPTIDCLFHDPLQDGETVLKLWNLNKCGGVVGVFHCQGGGWNKDQRDMCPCDDLSEACESVVRPSDVIWQNIHEENLVIGTRSAFAVFCYCSGDIAILEGIHARLHVEIHPLEFDIFTIVPLITSQNLQFAAIGLVNMYNAGGAVQHVTHVEADGCLSIQVDLRGYGEFVAYASSPPCHVKRDNHSCLFYFDDRTGRVTVDIPWVPPHGLCTLTFWFSPLNGCHLPVHC